MRFWARFLFAGTLAVGTNDVSLAQDSSAVRSDKRVLIDFQDADLRLVITALAEAGGLNVTYGEISPRRVTLRFRQPLAPADVLPVLRSIALSNGLRVVEEGGLIRIEGGETTSALRSDSTTSIQSQSEPRLFVHRLRHAQAARIAATLQAVFNQRSTSADAAGPSREPLSQQLRGQRLPATTPDSQRLTPTSPAVAGPASLPAQLSSDIQIVPDEASNSLLVRATQEDWAILEQAVQ